MSLFLICLNYVAYWTTFREKFEYYNFFQTFFPPSYASPLNTDMTVNVSEHFIRDGAAGISECSLWSAIKSENQLVGYVYVC